MADVQLSTQGKSPFRYKWVILFVWQLNEEYPFSSVPLSVLGNNDFPMYLITGPLNDKSRTNKFQLSNLPGRKYSIFMKIEEGKGLNFKCYNIEF